MVRDIDLGSPDIGNGKENVTMADEDKKKLEELEKEKKEKEGKLEEMSKEEHLNYIKELRDENAKRRKRHTEAETALKDKEAEMDKVKSDMAELQKKIDTFDEEKSKAKKAEMEENERLKTELAEQKEKLSKLEQERDDKDKKIVDLMRKQTESGMVQQALALLNNQGFKFRSKVEERGFKAEVLEKGKDGKYKTENQIEDFVTDFLKENAPPPADNEEEEEEGKEKIPSAPGGRKTKRVAPSDQDRMKELLEKDSWTEQEIAEMTELENRIEASLPPAT